MARESAAIHSEQQVMDWARDLIWLWMSQPRRCLSGRSNRSGEARPRITHFVTAGLCLHRSSVVTVSAVQRISTPFLKDQNSLKQDGAVPTRLLKGHFDNVRVLLLNPSNVAQVLYFSLWSLFFPNKGTKTQTKRIAELTPMSRCSANAENRKLSKQECSQWWFWQLEDIVLQAIVHRHGGAE